MFDDPMYERPASWILAQALYGGADFGECLAAARIRGDAASWHQAWTETADRVRKIAEEGAANGRTISAREAYLRASNYYRASYIFFFGAPVDPRLVTAFDQEVEMLVPSSYFEEGEIELRRPSEVVALVSLSRHRNRQLIPQTKAACQVAAA